MWTSDRRTSLQARRTVRKNVIRVKATVKNFREETNMSVITESGSFYTFNVKYAEEPLLLNIEMKDFIHDGSEVNRPNNALDIYLKELGSESPKLVYLISKSVHKNNKRHIKHIGSKAFGIQYLLRGLYTHNGLLYFHTQIRNRSNVPYEVDFVTFKIVDKKVMKRTAIQEQVIFPLRAYDHYPLKLYIYDIEEIKAIPIAAFRQGWDMNRQPKTGDEYGIYCTGRTPPRSKSECTKGNLA